MVTQAIRLCYSSAKLSQVSAPVRTGRRPWCGVKELGRGGGCAALARFPFLAEPHTIIVFVVLVGTSWVFFLSSGEAFYDKSGKFAPCLALKTSILFTIIMIIW